MNNLIARLLLVLLLAGSLLAPGRAASALAAEAPPDPDSGHFVFTPLTQHQHMPSRPLDWDDRLDQRGAQFVPTQVVSGQGYWRLTQAVWLDEEESQGRHHILIDILDISGRRQTGVNIVVDWEDGSHTLISEAKPGEAYAANFGMYALAPAYNANPSTGVPADRVEGMGLGDLEHPTWSIHTSYGLTWRWTIAP